jgi:hypothetical protein
MAIVQTAVHKAIGEVTATDVGVQASVEAGANRD